MRLAQPCVKSEPGSSRELILCIDRDLATMWIVEFGERRALASRWADQAERLGILLGEGKESRPQVTALFDPREGGLAAFVFGSAILCRGSRGIQGAAFIVRGVVVKEGRDGQQQPGAHCAHPRE